MSGTEARIQAATHTYRDVTVAAMNEAAVREAAEDLGVDGFETTPLVTLREELVQAYRGRLRKNAYPEAVTMESPDPEEGNPGNDWVTLSDA